MKKPWQQSGATWLALLWVIAFIGCAALRDTSVPSAASAAAEAEDDDRPILIEKYPPEAGPTAATGTVSRGGIMETLDIDATCATLELIAQQHGETTGEYQAVELATKALLWIFTEGHAPAFAAALPSFAAGEPELSAAAEAAVRREVFEKHGIKPPRGL